MTWPNVLPNSAAFDADADSIAASRPELKKMSDAVNTLASNVYTAGATTGTITPDVANGEIQRITLTGNITMNAFANPVAGQRLTMIFQQPAAGSTYDLSSNMLWENGLESLTQINSAVDTAEIFYDGTNYYGKMHLAHGSVEVYAISVNPLQEDLDVNNFKIVNNVTNGNIVLEPNATGDVQLNTDTVRVGDSNANATITTNGTGELYLNTNNQGTSGAYIRVQSGTNSTGNIDIEPAGSVGLTRIKNLYTTSGSVVSISSAQVTIGVPGGQVSIGDVIFNSGFTCSGAAKITPGSALTAVNTQIDSAGSPVEYNRIFVSRGTSQDGPDINDMILQTYQNRVLLGVYNQNQTLSTHGAGDLTINTNTGLNSGYIKIFDGVDGNIEIIPNGTGAIVCNDKILRQVEFKDYAETVYNQGDVTGSFSVTVSNGNTQRMRLTGSVTFTGFTDAREGQTVTLLITQDGTGGRTFTEGLDSAGRMLFAGGVSTLSTGANAVDIMTISYIGGTYYASINKGYV